MRMRIIAFLVQYSIFIAFSGMGAELLAQSAAYFQYTVRDGLPSNLVYCCVQDKRGLLWFGTDKGLACFDGQRFRTYGMQDGLPDPEVLWMKEDSKGRLWLCCFSKKPCYMLNGNIVTEKEDTLLSKVDAGYGVGKVFEDSEGKIWYITRTNIVYKIQENRVDKFDFVDFISDISQVGDELFFWGTKCVKRIIIPNNTIVDSMQYNRKSRNRL
jgi:ligand-binding sensor domain-containing protein